MNRHATRRAFLVIAAGWPVLGWAGAARAQSKRGPIVIGWLSNSSRESGAASLAAFRQGLADLGWKEGAQVTIEARWADGKMDRLPALTHELAALKPAVIVASPSSRPVMVAAKEAPHIPREALVPMPSPLFTFERQRILRFAQAQRWPVAAGTAQWVEAGALLSYGADTSENFRRSAYFVDRILKGAKPGDLPLEQPRKFELVLNAKVAKTLGLKIPQELLLRADKVIE